MMTEAAAITSRRDPQPRPLRWGILGAARIARKALVGAVRAGGGEVVAIGASNRERAAAFAREFDIPVAAEGYAEVLADEAVEAVYIPLANGLHFRWALECARAGKHCLCEKPLVLNAEEARQLREAFAQADCRLVEAFMWRHHPQTTWIEELLRAGEIGELRRVNAAFSFPLDRPLDYRWDDELGGGSLWDLGCYCVNAMRLLFGDEPEAVSARSHPARVGGRADQSTVGWLDFGDGRLGSFGCSFTSAYHQELTLVGTEGLLRIERPFLGIAGETTAQIVSGNERQTIAFEPDNAYEHMVAHFTRAARDPSFALQPAEDGLAQAVAMEALAQSAAEAGALREVSAY